MSDAVMIRPLARGDVDDVLAAFLAADDMQRQGDVGTAEEATNYVDRLLGQTALIAPGPWSMGPTR